MGERRLRPGAGRAAAAGGHPGDRLGRRRLFLVGLVIFTGGSLACALATTALALELFRALQGVGGAVLFATGTPLLRAEFSGAVAASVLLASTTELRELLLGLQRLRLPPLLVQIASFMIRYGDVITDEMRRMRIARESRGFEARGVRHWGVLAKSAGALFIRSYERGERVHLAMVSRGTPVPCP